MTTDNASFLYIVTKNTFYKFNKKKALSLKYKICLSFILL